MREEVAAEVREFTRRTGVVPGLSVVLAGDDPASITYVTAKEKAAREAGIVGKIHRLPGTATQKQIIDSVGALNRDPAVHGILVQLPLPDHVDSDAVVQVIDPARDVDGLHPYNSGLLLAGKPRLAPATPSGIQRMLTEEGIETSGAHVVICGRSNIVGRPMAALMMAHGKGANATVTVCHTGTKDLAAMTRQADILIVAIGKPEVITAEMVRPGAVVIDVGMNRVAAPDRKSGFRLVGDVAYDQVAQVASHITPVPGGVGPMTIAMLLQNTLIAARASLDGNPTSL